MFRATRSGKTYRNEGRKGPKYSPLISPPLVMKREYYRLLCEVKFS